MCDFLILLLAASCAILGEASRSGFMAWQPLDASLDPVEKKPTEEPSACARHNPKPVQRDKSTANVHNCTPQEPHGGAGDRLCVWNLPMGLTPRLNNPPAPVFKALPQGGKLVWYMRHGESTANVAKQIAKARDEAEGTNKYEHAVQKNKQLIDAPLTDNGKEQAQATSELVASWPEKPTLIVASPMTRAIQTAAIIFEDVLASGAAKLVIRPELREFGGTLQENRGSTLEQLLKSPHLKALARWEDVKKALSPSKSPGIGSDAWGKQWSEKWATADGSWEKHCNDPSRLASFATWLAANDDKLIATVSHWGTINNILNREPWTECLPRKPVPRSLVPSAWPQCGLAKLLTVPNAGWVAVAETSCDVRPKSIGVGGLAVQPQRKRLHTGPIRLPGNGAKAQQVVGGGARTEKHATWKLRKNQGGKLPDMLRRHSGLPRSRSSSRQTRSRGL